ncbi:hypothetical protein HN419_01795 [Candidatus Woesearchaeota archaeon]|jgi:hypothetical protein|nr:hypothetical protein [Candidatus Woesearchaeota archaeon]MBT3537271.1 hypothetical protein [Candidatus Woesearchaeota archaeon]MBT4716587.1 hypothetical protein [Candidatus Woesearchaeota archaeon]MBT7106419.1 hypothetical protein [Candidatus Woesearchaeota archaeon]MBT7931206.1 hypothetical protein [Candidatus Woesearchaeota archaeon]
MEQKKEGVGEKNELLHSLISSNKLLSDANAELGAHLQDKSTELTALKTQLNDLLENTVSKDQFEKIRVHISRKNETLIKLNSEIEDLRKNNITGDALIGVLGKLKIALKNEKIENSLKEKDIQRLKIFLDEREEIIKTLMHETEDAKSYAKQAEKMLGTVQEKSHAKDDLLAKLNQEVEENKLKTIEAKQHLTTTKKSYAVLKEHIKSIEGENSKLLADNNNLKQTKSKILEITKENQTLKSKLSTIKNSHDEKHSLLINNVELLETLRTELDNVKRESALKSNKQKELIDGFIAETRNKIN